MNSLLTRRILPWLRRAGTIVPTLLLALFVSLPVQAVDDPSGVQFTLSACRLEDGNLIKDKKNGEDWFYCENKANKSAYTTGNLGKLWSELDIVPHRLVVKTQSNDPNQTYRLVLSGDHLLAEADDPNDEIIGWDLVTTPLVIEGSCVIVGMDPQMNAIATGVVGGVHDTLVRWIDIQHPSNTTCVIDYGMRLSIRSSGFSGSSLHSQILKQDFSSIGNRTLSLPVKDILPQEISKTMTATRDVESTWSLRKSANEALLDFGDTCQADEPLTAQVDVTIEWSVTSAPGGVTKIITTINAKNPSTRDIIVDLSDALYNNGTASGTPFHTFDTEDASLPAGTEFVYDNGNLLGILVKSGHNGPIAIFDIEYAGALGNELSNKVTASYIDFLFPDVPIEGTEQATSSTSVTTGDIVNATAVISDLEVISGAGLMFSVDAVSGEQGTFNPAYVLGTPVKELAWQSSVQTTDGFVTFHKTIHLEEPSIVTGNLYDKATLESEKQTITGSVDVTLIANATVDLEIVKEIDPAVLGLGESATFKFEVSKLGEPPVEASIEIVAGDQGSTLVTGLAPGSYQVLELATAGFSPVPPNPKPVVIDLPACFGTVTFVNTPDQAKAKVVKVTLPAGLEAGWEFTLYKNGGVVETGVTLAGGNLSFAAQLGEGNYTIVETAKPDWDLTGITPPVGGSSNLGALSCSFSVNLPADANKEFVCTFENTQRGKLIVRKLTEGPATLPPAERTRDFGFTSLNDNPFAALTLTPPDFGVPAQQEYSVAPGQYIVIEDVLAAPWSLVHVACDDGNSIGDPASRTALYNVEPGETVTCTFTNRRDLRPGSIIIHKTSIGGTASFGFGGDRGLFSLDTGVANPNSIQFLAVEPGFYHISEDDPTALGFRHLAAELYCDDPLENINGVTTVNGAARSVHISVDDGETVQCYFFNEKLALVDVVKTLAGNPLAAGEAFTFEIRQSDGLGGAIASATAAGPLAAGESVSFSCMVGSPDCETVNGKAMLPAGDYAFCETNMQPGWKNVEVDQFGNPLVPQNWFVPGGGDPEADNSTECIAFTLVAGESKTFYVDDVPPPGGDARTIGFWKNWTSCDGSGNQDAVLDANLPVTLYTGFSVSQCPVAVDLLDKRDIAKADKVGDGQKKANDAAYALAAQYLAYLLNQNAGAGSCLAADNAATQAAALLMQISFNGKGNYLPPNSKNSLATLREQANNLAGILDSYNNNTLCP